MDKKKILSFAAAIAMVSSFTAPAFAESADIALPVAEVPVAEVAGEVPDSTDIDGTDTADTADDALPEETAAESETVYENGFTEESGEIPDTDDTAAEATEDIVITADDTLLEDEEEFLAGDWYTWNASTGTLTLRGQLPDTDLRDHTIRSLAYLANISPSAVKKVVVTPGTKTGIYAQDMFNGMGSLAEIQGLNNLDTSKAVYMNTMFDGCGSLRTLDLSSFDTSHVVDMFAMFRHCTYLYSIDLSSFDTSHVQDMEYMFASNRYTRIITVSDKWSTKAVQHSDGMFANCDALTGGSGTKFDDRYTTHEYARIDKGAQRPGYLTSDVPVTPTVTIKTAFGGKTVQFNCTDPDAVIYYQTGSSNITLSCRHVYAGKWVFFDTPMSGKNACIYFRAYKKGKWSPVGKWGLLNVKLDKPLIVQSGARSANNFKVYTQAKDSYIVYTIDGSTPAIEEGVHKLTVTNGRIVWGTSAVINVPRGKTIKAIAIRNGLVTSDVMTYSNK